MFNRINRVHSVRRPPFLPILRPVVQIRLRNIDHNRRTIICAHTPIMFYYYHCMCPYTFYILVIRLYYMCPYTCFYVSLLRLYVPIHFLFYHHLRLRSRRSNSGMCQKYCSFFKKLSCNHIFNYSKNDRFHYRDLRCPGRRCTLGGS